jgi:hypothetical protein
MSLHESVILGFGETGEDTFCSDDDLSEPSSMFSQHWAHFDELSALEGEASPMEMDCSSDHEHIRPGSLFVSSKWEENRDGAAKEEHGLHKELDLDFSSACQDAWYHHAETEPLDLDFSPAGQDAWYHHPETESLEEEDPICEGCTTSMQAVQSSRLNKPKKARLPRTAAKKSATQRPKSSIAKKEPAAEPLPWAKTEKAKHTNKNCMQKYRAEKQSIIKGRVRKELGRRYANWRRAPDSREYCSQGISERYQAFITELEQRSEEEQQNVQIPTWPNPKA